VFPEEFVPEREKFKVDSLGIKSWLAWVGIFMVMVLEPT
jgi:hypothetical protein